MLLLCRQIRDNVYKMPRLIPGASWILFRFPCSQVQADIGPIEDDVWFCPKNSCSSIPHWRLLSHVSFHALLMSPVHVENCGDLPVVHYEHNSQGLRLPLPSSPGFCSTLRNLGDGCAAPFHQRGQCWETASPPPALFNWEALFLMRGRVIFLSRMLQLFISFHQQWEICWAWEEIGGWPLAVVFLSFRGMRQQSSMTPGDRETGSWILLLDFSCITSRRHFISLGLSFPLSGANKT